MVVPVTVHQNVWLMYEHIFQLQCKNTSLLHIPGGGCDAADLLFGRCAPWTSIPCISSSGATRNRLCMKRWWLQWRTSQLGSSSLQLTSPAQWICLNASNNPLSVGVVCTMTYADATSSNSCDNHLLLHF
ncbi:hypothetical protein TNCV_1026331 [Trichonephila clavipes]|nr:hypothetical protein TNCV_1026331 [Trichonephila clavipes]